MCNVRVRLQTGGVNTFVAMHDAQLSYVHTGVSARVRASTGASCVMIGFSVDGDSAHTVSLTKAHTKRAQKGHTRAAVAASHIGGVGV